MKHSGIARDTRGQALVETALILLALFLFLFGIWEAGRVIQVQQALTDAAREGARLSVPPKTQTMPGETLYEEDASRLEAAVQSYLNAAFIYGATVNVDPAFQIVLTTGTTTFTQVTVTYTYHVMTVPLFGLNDLTLHGNSLMRNETSQ